MRSPRGSTNRSPNNDRHTRTPRTWWRFRVVSQRRCTHFKRGPYSSDRSQHVSYRLYGIVEATICTFWLIRIGTQHNAHKCAGCPRQIGYTSAIRCSPRGSAVVWWPSKNAHDGLRARQSPLGRSLWFIWRLFVFLFGVYIVKIDS